MARYRRNPFRERSVSKIYSAHCQPGINQSAFDQPVLLGNETCLHSITDISKAQIEASWLYLLLSNLRIGPYVSVCN